MANMKISCNFWQKSKKKQSLGKMANSTHLGQFCNKLCNREITEF